MIRASATINIAIIVLVLLNVDVSSEEFYQPSDPTSDDHSNFNDQYNDNAQDRSFRWPRWIFEPNYSSKPAQHPTSNINNNQNYEPQNGFLFPSEVTRVRAGTGYQTITPCNGETFCEDVPDYPTNLVNQLIGQQPQFRSYQIDDTGDPTLRTSGGPETVPLCLTRKEIKYPKKAQSVTGEWMYIFNTANFVQGILIETCVDEGTPCKLFSDFAYGYVTSCRQKYVHRELMGMKQNNVSDRQTFRFPTSCCCHVELAGDSGVNRK